MTKRSLQDWASIAEIIGAVAIVMSLIYVAYEVGENTRALQATSRQALGDQDLAFFQTLVDSYILERAMDKKRRCEDLTDLEISQLQERQHLNFRIFENAYSQYRIGALEDREWERYQRVVSINMCTNEMAKGMWPRYENGFDPEFREVVSLAEAACK